MDSVTKFRMDVEYKIDNHADRLSTPTHIVESAKEMYQGFNHEDAAYSRSDDVYALASLYLAYKTHDEPILMAELIGETDEKKKHVIRAYKQIQSKLAQTGEIGYETFDPKSFIDKFAEQLELSEETRRQAIEVFDETGHVVQNCAAHTQAASSINVASILNNDDIQLKTISGVSDTSEVTIRKRSQSQMEELSE